MIPRRNFLVRAVGVLAAFLTPAVLRAAPRRRADTKPDSTEKPKTARLRLWKATDAPQKPLQIRVSPLGNSDLTVGASLTVDTQEYQFGDYESVPAGAVTAVGSVAGQTPVQAPFWLPPDSQFTLFVRFQGGQLLLEWLDDTAGAPDAGCEFTAYNLLPASGVVQIALGTVLSGQLASIRSILRLSGIKPASYPISVTGNGAAGREIRWNSDMDFAHCRKARLLIYSDPYGRVRPRLYVMEVSAGTAGRGSG